MGGLIIAACNFTPPEKIYLDELDLTQNGNRLGESAGN